MEVAEAVGELSAKAVLVKADYVVWNEALVHAYFGPEQAGQMVYLDQDDEAFGHAAATMGVELNEAAESLAGAVRERLCWKTSGHPAFAVFDIMTQKWMAKRERALEEGRPVAVPPHVALLMVFSIAAEKMGSTANSDTAEAGFYAQLENLLGVPKVESQRFRNSFTNSSEAYWESLNVWLEGHDGELGLPSAYALTHRYVDLPVSQALIRDAERRNLHRMFHDQGFIPGMFVAHEEMHGALDVWMHSARTTANRALTKLWESADTQKRVTDIALAEFATWVGPSEDERQRSSGQRGSHRCLLTLRETRKSLSTVYNFGLVASFSVDGAERGRLISAQGEAIEVVLRSRGIGHVGIDFGSLELDNGSLLAGDIRIDTATGCQIRRLPKKVVIFTRDPITDSFVESDRITPAVISRVLVRDQGNLVDEVERVLADAAQPGYARLTSGAKGLPDGWAAFDKVQILRTPKADLVKGDELSGFQPRLSTQMSLSGGLKLPGRIARWSSISPLELLIASDSEEQPDLYVTVPDPETLQPVDRLLRQRLTVPTSIPLSDLPIAESDFTLSLRTGKKVLQTLSVRLRDSSSVGPETVRPYRFLCHDLKNALWPVLAVPRDQAKEVGLDGLEITAPVISGPVVSVPKQKSWKAPPGVPLGKQRIKLPTPGADSCIVTGVHKWILPAFDGRRPKTPSMYGVCEQCGMSRRFPTKAKRVEQRTTGNSARRRRSPLPVLVQGRRNWKAVVDALAYLGSGSRREFSVLARQIEDSAIFEHRLLTALEVLGLLELERNRDFEVTHWEVAATGIGELTDGSWLLTGLWNRETMASVCTSAEQRGGEVRIVAEREQSMTVLANLDIDSISALAAELNVQERRRTGHSLAAILPSLSSVSRGLERSSMPATQIYEFFDVNSARWLESESAEHPGLYRVTRSFNTSYFFRSFDDISRGTAAKVSAELGKHLAANEFGNILAGYDPETETLSVPIGADLPGIYGRAAVMCGGRLPFPVTEASALHYLKVDSATAAILIGKLAS